MDQSGWSGDEEEEEEDVIPPPAKRKKRMCYTSEEEDILAEYFKLTTLKRKPNIPLCRDFLQEKKTDKLFTTRDAQSIQDKLKNMMKKK